MDDKRDVMTPYIHAIFNKKDGEKATENDMKVVCFAAEELIKVTGCKKVTIIMDW